MELNKTVMIGGPIRNREWIISYYLRNLYNQTYPKHLCEILWLINNSTDKTFEILTEFKNKHEHEYRRIRIQVYNESNMPEDNRTVECREAHTYSRLAELRNRVISEFLKTDCDLYLNCDSDILMRKDCLERLVSHNKDFVAGLIYNGYLMSSKPGEPGLFFGDPVEKAYLFPNILNETSPNHFTHVVNNRIKNPERAKDKPLLQVQFTGAINVLSRAVCEKARYGYDNRGEDYPFCRDALKAGFEIWCDLYNYNQHVMAKDFLEQFKNFGIEGE